MLPRVSRPLVPLDAVTLRAPQLGTMNDHHERGNCRPLALLTPGIRGATRGRRLHVLIALCSVSALALAWNTLPPALTRGPYLQSASATGITVVFRTSTAETST